MNETPKKTVGRPRKNVDVKEPPKDTESMEYLLYRFKKREQERKRL